MAALKRAARLAAALLLLPFLLAGVALALAAVDLAFWIWRRVGRTSRSAASGGAGGHARRAESRLGLPRVGSTADSASLAACATERSSASVVIPNWNGRDLLERYLPSVVEAMAGNSDNEILVVDNGSTDGSAEYLRAAFPGVKVLALPENRGFGGGSNAGVAAAANDTVVLLNSDMRVDCGFLAPLLEGFRDPDAFAVSCQIFFSDPHKLREETGLTQGRWRDGALRVRHRIDPQVDDLFPCFYGGGGSCAFDRRKFLELGGFDPIYEPFYLEDTDLSYMAWKRGWKVLYQPRSVVYHEHRGTIGRRFSAARIEGVLKRNYALFAWKNVHEARRLTAHFFFAWMGAALAAAFGDVPLRPNSASLCRAGLRLGTALKARWRARELARVSDTEAFARPMPGYFHDRFSDMKPSPPALRVLFVSPYPICPPVHGGGVLMYQTLREMSRLAETHVVELLDWQWQAGANEELREICVSAEWMVRPGGADKGIGQLSPHAVREIADEDLEWLIHRQIYRKRIDVLQLEYTAMAQFGVGFRRLAVALFEHDVYFQSIARGLGRGQGAAAGLKARFEYLRALRYELRALPGFDQVQVCTKANADYLLSFLPELAPKLKAGLRAGLETERYRFQPGGREPLTMLFLGSFRHDPNRAALEWFLSQALPRILEREPRARVVIVGSDPPPAHAYADYAGRLEMRGYVEDVREPLAQCAVFVCPILSGSGVRVKLLEAFAAGIPVVSTRVGAEGLASEDGGLCCLADDAVGFAERVLALFADPEAAAAMAVRARAEVETNWDSTVITRRLVDGYGEIVERKRAALSSSAPK